MCSILCPGTSLDSSKSQPDLLTLLTLGVRSQLFSAMVAPVFPIFSLCLVVSPVPISVPVPISLSLHFVIAPLSIPVRLLMVSFCLLMAPFWLLMTSVWLLMISVQLLMIPLQLVLSIYGNAEVLKSPSLRLQESLRRPCICQLTCITVPEFLGRFGNDKVGVMW